MMKLLVKIRYYFCKFIFVLVSRALNELKDENIKIKAYVEPVVTESN